MVKNHHMIAAQDDLEDMGGVAPFSVTEILEHCIEPTVTDGLRC